MALYPQNHPPDSVGFERNFGGAWRELFPDSLIRNPLSLMVPVFSDYFREYLLTYTVAYQDWKAGRPRNKDISAYIDKVFDPIPQITSGKLTEYAFASNLFDMMIQEHFEAELLVKFKEFTNRYPKSAYTSYLQPYAEKIESYAQASAKPMTKQQHILRNYRCLNSLSAILDSCKGQFVFVDIWATWCGPCKSEFAYNDSLRQFLQDNDIKMLYISVDKSDQDKEWKNMIRYYDLRGDHVRANDTLMEKIVMEFGGTERFSVPRYLLFDPNGNLVEKDALRPSDTDKLYAQLKSHVGATGKGGLKPVKP